MTKFLVILITACISLTLHAASKETPSLPSGTYRFAHKQAEFQNPRISGWLKVKIDRSHITVINAGGDKILPKGVIAEGTLIRHKPSGKWIISTQPSDLKAQEVGGCSDGPEVVDLKRRIYWTC